MSPITNTILYYITIIIIFLFPIITFLFYDNLVSQLKKLKTQKQKIIDQLYKRYKKKKKKAKTKKEKKKLKLQYYYELNKNKKFYDKLIESSQLDYYIALFAQYISSIFFIFLFWGDMIINFINYIMGYRRIRIQIPLQGRAFTLS